MSTVVPDTAAERRQRTAHRNISSNSSNNSDDHMDAAAAATAAGRNQEGDEPLFDECGNPVDFWVEIFVAKPTTLTVTRNARTGQINVGTVDSFGGKTAHQTADYMVAAMAVSAGTTSPERPDATSGSNRGSLATASSPSSNSNKAPRGGDDANDAVASGKPSRRRERNDDRDTLDVAQHAASGQAIHSRPNKKSKRKKVDCDDLQGHALFRQMLAEYASQFGQGTKSEIVSLFTSRFALVQQQACSDVDADGGKPGKTAVGSWSKVDGRVARGRISQALSDAKKAMAQNKEKGASSSGNRNRNYSLGSHDTTPIVVRHGRGRYTVAYRDAIREMQAAFAQAQTNNDSQARDTIVVDVMSRFAFETPSHLQTKSQCHDWVYQKVEKALTDALLATAAATISVPGVDEEDTTMGAFATTDKPKSDDPTTSASSRPNKRKAAVLCETSEEEFDWDVDDDDSGDKPDRKYKAVDEGAQMGASPHNVTPSVVVENASSNSNDAESGAAAETSGSNNAQHNNNISAAALTSLPAAVSANQAPMMGMGTMNDPTGAAATLGMASFSPFASEADDPQEV